MGLMGIGGIMRGCARKFFRSFSFFLLIQALCPTGVVVAGSPDAIVEKIGEELAQLREYLPPAKNPALLARLKVAESHAKAARYPEAATEILQIKFSLIGRAIGERRVLSHILHWGELGFFPSDTDEGTAEANTAFEHVRSDLNAKTSTEPEMLGAIQRYLVFESMSTVFRLREDSALYETSVELKQLSHKLFKKFLRLDGVRKLDNVDAEILEDFQNIAVLSARFTEQKRRESVTASILVLQALQKQGADSGQASVAYHRLGESISILEKRLDAPEEGASPFASAFSVPNQLEEGAQLQVLKFELARRVFGRDSLRASWSNGLRERIAELLRMRDTSQFWQEATALREFLSLSSHRAALQPESNAGDTRLLTQLAPDQAQGRVLRLLSAYANLVDKLDQNFAKNSTTWQSLDPWSQERSIRALKDVRKILETFGKRVASLSQLDALAEVSASVSYVQLVLNYAIEAAMERSATAPGYVGVLRNLVGDYQSGKLVLPVHQRRLRALLLEERSEGVRRAYVNKDTITTAALTALLVGEAVSVLHSGGASASAMPATIAAIRAVGIAGRALLWTSRAVVAASSASNLVDRYRAGGWGGLVNEESAVDALMFMTVLPKLPLVIPVGKEATSTVGMLGQWLLTKGANYQFSLERSLNFLLVGWEAYRYVYAESISDEYRRMGIDVSPTEVRTRAAGLMAVSLITFWGQRNQLVRARLENPTQARVIDQAFSWTESGLVRRIRGAINPWAAAKNYYSVRPAWLRSLVGSNVTAGLRGVGALGVGLGYVGLDYLVINEGLLLSQTNPDFNYLNSIQADKPFPVLNEGESAVALVGLSPLDALLYLGAHAKFTHSREQALYGDRYGVENYVSPENLFEQLVAYAREHGKIRYLKIMTHGRPGKLFTQVSDEVGVGGEDSALAIGTDPLSDSGWLDRRWLQKNRVWARRMAKLAFAPDARIVLWSCLTGANFDERIFSSASGSRFVGTEFLDDMGQSMLPDGGRIDASTRILVGVESTMGALGKHLAYDGKRVDEAYRRVVPVVPLDSKFDDMPSGLDSHKPDASLNLVWDNFSGRALGIVAGGVPEKDPGVLDQAWYLGKRTKYVLIHLPEIWWHYGLMLEGPWWNMTYRRHVDVPPTAD